MILNLNDSVVARLPFAEKGKRYEVNDKRLPGLIVRIGTRSKTYYWRSTVNGKRITVQLGKDGGTTAQEARLEALKMVLAAHSGYLPITERDKRTKSRSVPTLQEAFEEYIRLRKLRATSIYSYKKHFRLYLSEFSGVKLTEITSNNVLTLYKQLCDSKSPAKANDVLALLKSVMRFAAATFDLQLVDIHEKLKAAGVKQPTPAKSDLIPDHEAFEWYSALNSVNARYRSGMLFTILTGMRAGEVSGLRWRNINFELGTVTAEFTKNGRIHTLPLGVQLLSWLRQWRLESGNLTDDDLVFGNRVDHWAYFVSRKVGIKFSMHSLRRTFATQAAKVATNAYLVKAVLNHAVGADVTQTHYIRYSFEDLRETMQSVENQFLALWHLNE